jgi:hypothetical protein
MLQFYFLSVIMNIIAGIVLSAGFIDERVSFVSGMKDYLDGKPNIKLTVGVITFIVGFFKLLSVTRGDVPVVGDLLPAVAGLVMGFTLFLDYYKSRSTVSSSLVDWSEKVLLNNSNIIGLTGIAIGFLHFLLPRVLFL